MTIPQQKQTISRLAQSGQLANAKQLCSSLCAQTPTDPEVWFLLGAIHGQLSDYPEAENCCRRALTLAPQHPMLNLNLAISLLQQGKSREACKFLEKAIEVQPDFADAYRELGNAQAANNEPFAAITSYQKAIEIEPDSAIAFYNLGNLFRDLERLNEAAESYQQAISLKPDFSDAYCELASVLIIQFKYTRVIETLESAVKLLPDSAGLFFKLAVAYQEQGDSDIALRHYEKTLELDEEHYDAQIGIAGILGLQGRYAEAGKLLDRLLAASPGNPTTILTYAHFAHRFDAADRAIELVKGKLAANDCTDRTKAKLHFSLADLYERKELIEPAFEHYKSGNLLRGAKFNYESYSQMFNALINTYSAENISNLAHSDNDSNTPIFIVGMPRSGTSLIEQILASHPSVFGAGELRNINHVVDKLPEVIRSSNPYPFCTSELTTPLLNQLASEYIKELKERSNGTEYVTDKMPMNFIHLGFIDLMLPNARIIHCVRDPRDTCLSCYFKHFSGEHSYAYSLTDLGNFYQLYHQLMTHWKKVIRIPIYEVSYEKLVLNQEMETRKLLDFCSLEWADSCLQFHRTERTVSTASHDQVRQPIYSKSIGRWRSFEKHLTPLFSSLNINH